MKAAHPFNYTPVQLHTHKAAHSFRCTPVAKVQHCSCQNVTRLTALTVNPNGQKLFFRKREKAKAFSFSIKRNLYRFSCSIQYLSSVVKSKDLLERCRDGCYGSGCNGSSKKEIQGWTIKPHLDSNTFAFCAAFCYKKNSSATILALKVRASESKVSGNTLRTSCFFSYKQKFEWSRTQDWESASPVAGESMFYLLLIKFIEDMPYFEKKKLAFSIG
jgi:hypothetical protein